MPRPATNEAGPPRPSAGRRRQGNEAWRHCLVVVGAGLLVGCASGPLPGRLMQAGKPPERVALHYESSLFGSGGKLSTTLPGGEQFKGRYQLLPQAPDHHMISTLSGSRGGTLTCRFKLNEPGIGPDGGGAGQCELSTGGTIDFEF